MWHRESYTGLCPARELAARMPCDHTASAELGVDNTVSEEVDGQGLDCTPLLLVR